MGKKKKETYLRPNFFICIPSSTCEEELAMVVGTGHAGGCCQLVDGAGVVVADVQCSITSTLINVDNVLCGWLDAGIFVK
jgi:hypothetical protein